LSISTGSSSSFAQGRLLVTVATAMAATPRAMLRAVVSADFFFAGTAFRLAVERAATFFLAAFDVDCPERRGEAGGAAALALAFFTGCDRFAAVAFFTFFFATATPFGSRPTALSHWRDLPAGL
jgi:hypothetical protein